MCQLCQLVTISERDRWPTPLEPTLSSLRDTIKSAHLEAEAYTTGVTPTTLTPARNNLETRNDIRTSLVATTRILRATLDLLDQERDDWWKAKAPLRRQLAEAGAEEKLRRLQIVNNSAAAMARDMRAKLGVWARWGLEVGEGELEVE